MWTSFRNSSCCASPRVLRADIAIDNFSGSSSLIEISWHLCMDSKKMLESQTNFPAVFRAIIRERVAKKVRY